MAILTRKLVRLKQQLAAAERREQIIQQELAAAINQQIFTPYEGRGNLTDYYVQSFTDPELVVKVSVPTESLTKCLDTTVATALTRVNGLSAVPAGAAEASQKGFAKDYYRVKFIHTKATPVAKLTKWGTRVVTYYDKVGNQAFREIPIGGDIKDIEIKYAAIIASPAPFVRGIIQLISPTGDVVKSKRIGS